jgi:hypothetical protein
MITGQRGVLGDQSFALSGVSDPIQIGVRLHAPPGAGRQVGRLICDRRLLCPETQPEPWRDWGWLTKLGRHRQLTRLGRSRTKGMAAITS